ncbi:uncharacterized protein LOC144109828 [Amblyomma americanum]
MPDGTVSDQPHDIEDFFREHFASAFRSQDFCEREGFSRDDTAFCGSLPEPPDEEEAVLYLVTSPKLEKWEAVLASPDPEGFSETTVASTTATLEHQQKCFFTKAFPEGSSQEQLFHGVVQEPLDAFIEGRNVLLFAYGPTAGGKTHTMQGPYIDPGIVPCTLDRLFHLLGTQICQGAPVRPDCSDEVVQLSTTEEAAVSQLKNQLLGE